MSKIISSEINALKVNQWLKEWNDIQFGPGRAKPKPFFYFF